MSELTNNFQLHEFACNDKAHTPVPTELIQNVQELANNLQVLRDFINEPIHINSGYRTESYNKATKGSSPKSQHLLAKAGDMTTKSYTPKQLAAIIKKLIKQGKMKQGGVGIYPSFCHYDIRGTAARW